MPQSDRNVLFFNIETSALSYMSIGGLHALLNHYPGHQLFTQPIPRFAKKVDVVVCDDSARSTESAEDLRTVLVWLPRKVVLGRLRGRFRKLWIGTGMDDVVY